MSRSSFFCASCRGRCRFGCTAGSIAAVGRSLCRVPSYKAEGKADVDPDRWA
jgi:hypothetical protein